MGHSVSPHLIPRQPLTNENYAFILLVNTISSGKRKTLNTFLQLYKLFFHLLDMHFQTKNNQRKPQKKKLKT